MRKSSLPIRLSVGVLCCVRAMFAAEPELILHHGKIVTVDPRFSVHQAIAVTTDRITAVGDNDSILQLKGPATTIVDLQGKMVLPGLIDSHIHPDAAMTEFDHPVPEMETIQDVLDYIGKRAEALKEGEWIQVSQVFITRLREQRYPTRAELDRAAPRHPVIFSTGPDASLNSLALKLSGIDKDFKVIDGGGGFVEKDPQTGEPTGILRNCSRFVKDKPTGKQPSEEDRYQRTLQLFKDYNSVGITTICDRNASPSSIARYKKMLEQGDLTVRVAISHHIDTLGPIEEVKSRIREVAKNPLCQANPRLRIIGIKTF